MWQITADINHGSCSGLTLSAAVELLTFTGIFSIVNMWFYQTANQGFLIIKTFAAELAVGPAFFAEQKKVQVFVWVNW